MSTFIRDPNSVLPYTVDWSDWLESFEGVSPIIVAHEIIADDGITVESSSNDSTSVTAVISGGTVGQVYAVTFRAILNLGGYRDDRTIKLITRQR